MSDDRPDRPHVRDTVTGELEHAPTLDEALQYLDETDDYDQTHPTVFHASQFGCHRRKYWDWIGRDLDPGESPYPKGMGMAGDASEDAVEYILNKAMGWSTPIVDNVRITRKLDAHDGNTLTLTGRADPIILGDNLEVERFYEVKSKQYGLPKALKSVAEMMGRRAPLWMPGIGIRDAQDEGVVPFRYAVQASVYAHTLAENGRTPKETSILYVDQSNYEEHMSILVSPSIAEFLVGVAEDWVREQYEYRKNEETPPPRFTDPKACSWCSYSKQCAAFNENSGEEREMWEPVKSINEDLEEFRAGGSG